MPKNTRKYLGEAKKNAIRKDSLDYAGKPIVEMRINMTSKRFCEKEQPDGAAKAHFVRGAQRSCNKIQEGKIERGITENRGE